LYGVKVGFRFPGQVNVWRTVGFEWNNVGVVLEANERAAKKVRSRRVPAPEAFLVEQECVKLDHPGGGLGCKEVHIHVIRQVFGFDLINSQNLAQEVKEVRRFGTGL